MKQASIITVGPFRRMERVRLATLVQQAGLAVHHAKGPDELQEQLGSTECRGMLIDGASELVEASLRAARTHALGRYVPIFLVAGTLDDLTFANAFNLGADDVVTLTEPRPLLARLRRISTLSLKAPPLGSKAAIVVDPDVDRRVVRARALHNAGYDVRFADSMEEGQTSMDDRTELLVLDGGRAGGLQTLRESARLHSKVAHVLLDRPGDVTQSVSRLDDVPNATATDAFGPPQNIVFVANELRAPAGRNNRESRRLLFGTVVAFRGLGRDRDDFGFSYNLSAGGLYVRTLAPPEEDTLWLELTPPRTDLRVRLDCRVAWRRQHDPATSATVPSGFAVEIVDATRSSASAWLAGYKALDAA